MTQPITAILLKLGDADLSVSAAVVALVYAWALALGWIDVRFRTKVMMYGVILFSVVVSMFAGNLTWAFYVEHADPLLSLAHPAVRLLYVAGGAVACDMLLAIPLGVRLHAHRDLLPAAWLRAFLVLSVINLGGCALLFALDLYGIV